MTRLPVGVVIPAYDAWPEVGQAIQSVLVQDAPTTVVVVDDGSEQPLEPLIANRYPQVRVLRQDNMGQGAARNLGMGSLDTPLIGFLDSDDVWAPHFLTTQMRTLNRFPGATGVLASSNRSAVPVPSEHATQPCLHPLEFGQMLRTLRGGRGCSGWLFHREALMFAGGFDERFRRMQDQELLIRLLGLGHTILRDDSVLYTYNPSQERGRRYLDGHIGALELFSEKYGVDGCSWVTDRIGSAAQAEISGLMLSRASNVALANQLVEEGRQLAVRAARFSPALDRGRRFRVALNRRAPGVVAAAMRLMAQRLSRYPTHGSSQ